MRKPLPEEKPQTGFNLIVTKRDDKTGLVTEKDPYILRVIGETGSSEKQRLWERPAGSGNLWDKSNNPVGRWVYEEKVIKGKKVKEGKFVADAPHIAFTPPQTKDQILAKSLSEKEVKIAELERELLSIKTEKDKRSGVAPAAPKKEQGA